MHSDGGLTSAKRKERSGEDSFVFKAHSCNGILSNTHDIVLVLSGGTHFSTWYMLTFRGCRRTFALQQLSLGDI
jgi:hypothetical protein